jgi:GNAT superfamily N-acetyltransferase
MDRPALLDLFDREQRIQSQYPDMRKDVLPDVADPRIVRFVRPAPGRSFVLYSDLSAVDADAAIEEQIDYFTTHDLPFSWAAFDHDTPTDLVDRLVARGFEADDREAVMMLDLGDAPAPLLQPVAADVRPITQRDELADVIRVVEHVWGSDFNWITERMGSHLEIPGYLNIYAAYADDEPACVGWIYFPPESQFANLRGGSTLPAYRRRGLYTAILAVRVQEALQRGRRYLVIDTSPMSRPIVAHQGFQLLAYAQDFNWK